MRAAPTAQLERLWSGEIQFVDVEKRYRRKDGSFLWVRTTTALVRDGSTVRMLGRICARHHASQGSGGGVAAAAEAARNSASANCPSRSWFATSTGNITHYNRAAAELLNIAAAGARRRRRASTLIRSPSDVYLADGVTPVERANRPLARALRGETISNLELIVAPRDVADRRAPPCRTPAG